MASSGVHGDGPFFHVYNIPDPGTAPPVEPPPDAEAPAPPPVVGEPGIEEPSTPAEAPLPGERTTLTIIASDAADGGTVDNGPYPLLQLFTDGQPLSEPVAVTADHEFGKWQTLVFDVDQYLATVGTVGIGFVND